MTADMVGDVFCTEPGIYDLTMSCTRVVRAEVGFLPGVGWWWAAPGEASNDDWSMVVGSTRVPDAAPPEQTGAWSLVNQLMERTNSPTPRLALYAIGRLLQRWHSAKANYYDRLGNDGTESVLGPAVDEILAAQRELQELIKP